MRHVFSKVRFAALAFLVFGAVSAVYGVEPQVAFQLKDGWVEFLVRQDGLPVADASILVLDQQGKTFAEGQTEADGQSAFPLPPGAWFVVEIKTGKRTADPIRLVQTEQGLQPARVLLSYGLRPCCRVKILKDAANPGAAGFVPEEISRPWWPWLLLGAGLVAMVIAALNRRKTSPVG